MAIAFITGCLCGFGSAWLYRVSTNEHSDDRTTTASSSTTIAISETPERPLSFSRPGLDELLTARRDEVFSISGKFVKHASADELLALAEAWQFKVNRSNSPQNAWMLLLGRLVAFDPETALELGQQLKANGHHDDFAGLILRTWFALDPMPALAHAKTDPHRLLPLIVKEVARRDMPLALRLLDSHPNIPTLARTVLPELAKTDPLGAVGRAEAITDVRARDRTLRTLVFSWAKRDPDAALAYIANLDRPTLQLKHAAMEALIKEDPYKAEVVLQTLLPPGKTRLRIFRDLAQRKVDDDPDAALAWARGLPDSPERMTAIGLAAEAITEGVPERVLALLDEIGWENAGRNPATTTVSFTMSGGGGGSWDNGGMSDLAKSALLELAKTDPANAMGKALKLPPASDNFMASERTNLLVEMARAWSTADIVSYVDWLDQAGADVIPSELRPSLNQMPLDQANDLESRIPSLESSELKLTLERQLARRLAESEPVRAFEMANGLVGENRAQALVSVVESVAERDAEQGLEFFEQLPSAERREVTDALVRSLAQSDFGQARQWFASVPEADRGVDGYKALTSEWVKRDSMAASEWVGGLQPGTERDGAAVALVGELIFGNTPDLDSAMEWAESIGDQGQRDSWLRTVFVRMVSENPEAGRKAIRASSLSEDAKRTLLEP